MYIEDSDASFGGDTLFAHNTAGSGGTREPYMRLCESQVTSNKTHSRERMF